MKTPRKAWKPSAGSNPAGELQVHIRDFDKMPKGCQQALGEVVKYAAKAMKNPHFQIDPKAPRFVVKNGKWVKIKPKKQKKIKPNPAWKSAPYPKPII